MVSEDVVVLILAAGASSRMGRTKALLPWNGKTVLEHLVGQAEQADLNQVVVVTGASHTEICEKTAFKPDLFVENPQWASGMGTSIRTGLNQVLNRFPTCRGVLILLADQPLVDAAYLNALCRQFTGKPDCLVATRYGKACGVPALFGSSYFDALKGLPPEKGAKALLDSASDRVICLDPGPKGSDMDTPEAYEALKIQNDPFLRN